MKRLVLVVFFVFTSLTTFAHQNSNFDINIIITSCGKTFTFDDEGMTDDQIFALAEFIDDLLCGKPNIGM